MKSGELAIARLWLLLARRRRLRGLPPCSALHSLLPLPCSSGTTTTTRQAASQQPKGVSMKQLLKEASKGKPG